MIDLRFSVYKRRGRKGWTLEYHEPGRARPVQRSFPTKTDATAEWDRIKARRRAIEGLAEDRAFREFSAAWLAGARVSLRFGTIKTYEWALAHLLNAFGHLTVRQITAQAVKDFVVARREGGLAKKSVANLKGTLYTILEEARAEGILASNPAAYRGRSKLLKLTPSRAERRAKVKAMDLDQLRVFLETCEREEPAYYPLFRVSVTCGLRPGEAIGLKPEDLDYEGQKIRVRRGVTPLGHVEPTKSGEEGDVDMAPGLAQVLKRWEVAQKAQALASGKPREWLFPAAGGGFLGRSTVRGAFQRVLRAARLPLTFSPHSLRHTFASLLLQQGESIYYVQRMLRHADIKVTVDTYGSWLPAGNVACVTRMEERLVR